MSVTMIHAGTQHNVLPDRCDFTVDVRSNELYTNERLYGLIREQTGCEVRARSLRLNSSRTDREHPFVVRALMLGKEPFGSPTLSDQALMPFPSVKMGPGDSSRSHTADEYVCLPEIRDAIETYTRLLDGLTIG
jgi:acetylornithine deacetylase